MAVKGTTEIELEMFAALEGLMEQTIRGDFYTSGTRPVTATTEDAVLTVSNAGAAQIEEGRARINIFVPGIDNGGETLVPDKGRLKQLEAAGAQVVRTLNDADTDYLFELLNAPASIQVPGTEVWYVNIVMKFKFLTFNE